MSVLIVGAILDVDDIVNKGKQFFVSEEQFNHADEWDIYPIVMDLAGVQPLGRYSKWCFKMV